MEFTKDIHFSNILRGNKTSEITYSGELFQKQSESVTIVYGFGENWESTTETEMNKTENGFTAQIKMKENFDTFNFCFRNGNYEWDNNQSFNYISPIQPAILETKKVKILGFSGKLANTKGNLDTPETIGTNGGLDTVQTGLDNGFNNDVLLSILDNLLEQTLQSTENIVSESHNKQQILDDILSENTATNDFVVAEEEFNMDTLIEDILNPVINCETREISSKNVTPFEEINLAALEDLKQELILNLDIVGETVTSGTTETVGTFETVEVTETLGTSQNVATAEVTNTSKEETTDLVPVSEDTFLVSPRKLRKFYLLGKKIKLAFYKLFVAIPKLLYGTLGEDKNN